MRLNYIPLFITTMALVGCATNAENQYESINKGLTDINAQVEQCFAGIDNNSSYNIIRNYLPISNSGETIEMLSNQKIPTQQESKVLTSLANDMKKCRNIRTSGQYKISNALGSISQENSDRKDALYVSLIQRKITWGEGVKQLKQINSDSAQKEAIAFANIQGGLQNQHNAEIAQRQRAAMVMQNAGYQMQQNAYQQQMLYQNQQVINNMNRPINTTCNSFGSTVNCTSR